MAASSVCVLLLFHGGSQNLSWVLFLEDYTREMAAVHHIRRGNAGYPNRAAVHVVRYPSLRRTHKRSFVFASSKSKCVCQQATTALPYVRSWCHKLSDRLGLCDSVCCTCVGHDDAVERKTNSWLCAHAGYTVRPCLFLDFDCRIVNICFSGSICSVARLFYLGALITPTEHFYDKNTYISVWSLLEPGVGITATSLATLRPLVRRIFNINNVQNSRSSSGNSKTIAKSIGYPKGDITYFTLVRRPNLERNSAVEEDNSRSQSEEVTVAIAYNRVSRRLTMPIMVRPEEDIHPI